MNFQDRQQDSLQSLLAQLRAAQDGPPSSAPQVSAPPPPPTQTEAVTKKVNDHAGASSRQLNDLLSSLGNLSQSSTLTSQPQPHPTPVPAAPRQLIAPFGPISNLSPSKKRSLDTSREGNLGEMSFTKALPIISALLDDPTFKQEVKRMKVDQDTLERRLWAKCEKVRVEHDKTTRTDREIARITGNGISPTKQREWRRQLDVNLQEFYRHTCLPSLDGLATRHRDRLEEMGVPGLGGDMGDPRVRERVRRLMDVIEAGLDE